LRYWGSARIQLLSIKSALPLTANGLSIRADLTLSTGTLDFIERVLAPFRTQQITILSLSRGEIIIGSGGLSGAMDTLYFLTYALMISSSHFKSTK